MKPTKENINIVIDGLKQFFEHMIQTKSFNYKEFINFMEPKFKAAGYRDENKSIRGGNILILTEGGAGDFVVTTGAIREIRRIYPDAHITLNAHPRTRELAECCPYVDELFFDSNDSPDKGIFDIYNLDSQLAQDLLKRRFDICFAFTIHATTPLLMYMSGARIRMTLINHQNIERIKNNNMLISHVIGLATHIFPCSVYGSHQSDDSFSLLENLLHMPITNRKLEIWYTPVEVARAKEFLKNASSPIYVRYLWVAVVRENIIRPNIMQNFSK